MKEECLICKAPLEYLETDELMECAICHKKENSKTRCVKGHYVCNDCHTRGMDTIIGLCLAETSKNPIEIIQKMMQLPFCHMHGPRSHFLHHHHWHPLRKDALPSGKTGPVTLR
jgi:hypothetical protein